MEKPEEILEPVDTDVSTEGFTLILYNDSVHEFDDVIRQVIKATGYGHDRAEAITMEAHTHGRAVVLNGVLQRCLQAQSVLEEIRLRTSIEVNA